MSLLDSIKAARKFASHKARSAYAAAGATGVVAAWPTNLTPPLTVGRDSGSTAVTFAASGSQLTASIASALAAGASVAATARVTQADGAGVLIPVTLTGLYAMAASPSTATVSTSAAPGTLVANLSNVPTGQTPVISPNDGRLVISGSEAAGWKVSVGLTAASAGSQTFTISAAGATSCTVAVTFAASALAPAYTFQRISTSALYTRSALGMSTTSKGPYFPCVVDVRTNPMYTGKVDYLCYFSSDHDSADGGIYLIACYGDPTIAANWKTYDQALAAGWFANVTGTKPAGNPIYLYGGVGGNASNETPWVNILDDGSWMMTTQVRNGIISGWTGQLSIRQTSTNGLSWTTLNPAIFLVPNAPEYGSNSDTGNHTGYLRWFRNPGLDVPYSWVGWSLIGGGAESITGMWGTNDPKGSWTYLGPCGGQLGRAVDGTPPPGTYGQYSVPAAPVGFRQTQQGLSAFGNWVTSSFYTNPVSGTSYEYLMDLKGKGAASQGRKQFDLGAAGSYDEMLASLSNIIDIGDGRVFAVEQGRLGDNTQNALNVAWASKSASEATFTPLTPAIPAALTSRLADYTTATTVPANFYPVSVGAPTVAYASNGKSVSFGASEAYYEFGDGFIPNNVEYVDIWVENLISTINNSRHFAIGFSRVNDNTVLANPGMYLESHPNGSTNYLYRTQNFGGATVRASMDTPGPGFGTLTDNGSTGYNFSRYNKDYGIRWFVKTGRMVVISMGGMEVADFGGTPVSFMDPTQTYYPFIMFKGVAASSTERFAQWGYSFKTGDGRVTSPFVPFGFAPVVDLNYNLNVYKVGNDIFTSRAAFEADPRVTTMDPAFGLHMINLAGSLSGGGSSTMSVQVYHTALKSAGTGIIANLDAGGINYTANAARLQLTSAGSIQAVALVGGSTVQTTSANAPTLADGANVCSVFCTSNSPSILFTTNHLTAGTGNFTGSVPTALNRLIVGGRPDNAALKYAGSIKRVVAYATRMNFNVVSSLAVTP
ncbi:hypothetical protein [Novosphingobium olei]|uniref:hypothetical protein n=1 Tax=Novosphingobium olei TaxID=2728851 RepID=UPI0030912645|nr:hypothetical protein NSDW_32800 [Novosphingobium olei]